jgi:starch synthase (maltosyl-transferring)
MREYFRPNFWPNTPDINPGELQQPNQAAYMARFFLAATLSSNYGLYGPVYEFMQWQPVPGKEEYHNSEKYEIKNWDWKKQTPMTDLITQVNAIRKSNPALQTTWNIEFCDAQNDQFLAYFKFDDNRSNHLLCIVNLDYDHVQEGLVKMPWNQFPEQGHRFLMSDLITGNQFVWQTEWNYVRLDPGQYPFHLFKVDPIE